MARHPSRDYIEASIVPTEGDMLGTEEEKLFAEFASDAKQADKTPTFSVWMLNTDAKTGKPVSSQQGAFLFDAPMDTYATFTEICSYLRDNYGSGHYRVTGRMMVNGSEKIGFNKIVLIREPKSKASVPGSQPVDTQNSQMMLVLQEMRRANAESQARFDRLLETMLDARRVEPPRSQFDVQSIVGIVGAIGTALGAVKGLFSPPTTQNNLLETLALIKGVKNITEEITDASPSRGGDDGLMTELVRTFGKPLAGLAMMQIQKQQAVPGRVLPVPANPATGAQQIAPAQTVPIQNMQGAGMTQTVNPAINSVAGMFKDKIRQLLGMAQAGMSASAVANVLLKQLSDADLEQLLPFIEMEDCVDQITRIEPLAHTYREWLETFRRSLLDQIEPVDTDHAESQDAGEPELFPHSHVSETDSDH